MTALLGVSSLSSRQFFGRHVDPSPHKLGQRLNGDAPGSDSAGLTESLRVFFSAFSVLDRASALAMSLPHVVAGTCRR